MIDKVNKKIESLFNDNSLINEAKIVVNKAAESNSFEDYLNFVENSKNLEEISFRIDYLKDKLVKEKLLNKNPLDKFGNAVYIEFDEI